MCGHTQVCFFYCLFLHHRVGDGRVIVSDRGSTSTILKCNRKCRTREKVVNHIRTPSVQSENVLGMMLFLMMGTLRELNMSQDNLVSLT